MAISLLGWVVIGLLSIVGIVILQYIQINDKALGRIIIESLGSFIAALIGGIGEILRSLIRESSKSIQAFFLASLIGIFVLAWIIGAFIVDNPAQLVFTGITDLPLSLVTWFVNAVSLGFKAMGNWILSGLGSIWPF